MLTRKELEKSPLFRNINYEDYLRMFTCFQAVERVGMPESGLILAHAVTALCLSKKSRATTDAWYTALEIARKTPNEPVPIWLRNAPTKLMRDLGYGAGQKWESGFHLDKNYLPDAIKDTKIWKA